MSNLFFLILTFYYFLFFYLDSRDMNSLFVFFPLNFVLLVYVIIFLFIFYNFQKIIIYFIRFFLKYFNGGRRFCRLYIRKLNYIFYQFYFIYYGAKQ